RGPGLLPGLALEVELREADRELAVGGELGGLAQRLERAVEVARLDPGGAEQLEGPGVLLQLLLREALLEQLRGGIRQVAGEHELGDAAQVLVLVEQALELRELEVDQRLVVVLLRAVERRDLRPVDLLRVALHELEHHRLRLLVPAVAVGGAWWGGLPAVGGGW